MLYLRRFILLAAGSLFLAPRGSPQESAQLSTVAFPISCNSLAAESFERATAKLHAFWFAEAEKEYTRAFWADTTCGMAQWGVAISLLGNPFVRIPPPPEQQRDALNAAERAVLLTATATRREQLYANAALALYKDYDSVPWTARMLRHEAAMQIAADSAPDDPEATVFLARAMIANAAPNEPSLERQQRAAALLEPIFVAQPDHPGLALYVIHAFDAPSVAKHGLAAARRYAAVGAAPHAMHMPSHIFTRLGYWEESIATNHKSSSAEADSNAAVHSLDYMVYAYLQLGRDGDAQRIIDRIVDKPTPPYQGPTSYNFTAMRARFVLERNAWADAIALPLPEKAAEQTTAIVHFARALGAARSGKVAIARENLNALARLRDALEQKGDRHWSTVIEAQRLAAAAWLAHAEGHPSQAINLARDGAALEETVDKDPVTPGPLIPARELEADLLFELERYGSSLWSYAKTLEREPKRARALFGAARAAERSGDAAQARRFYAQFALQMKDADSTRVELRQAKTFLAQRSEELR